MNAEQLPELEKIESEAPLYKFNREKCTIELEKVQVKSGEADRIKQAIDFINENVINKPGNITAIEVFINYDVCNYFGLTSLKQQKFITREFSDTIKLRRKKQKGEARIQEKREAAAQYEIDEEFHGLYLFKLDEDTGKIDLIPYTDAIADRVIENLSVISYKDQLYCYDEKSGFYRENRHRIEAEATRILNGILHDARSNDVCSLLQAVMRYVEHKNRQDEYPFNNKYKVIPVKNGVLKLDEETLEFSFEDSDPKQYTLNYVFPIEYNPNAPTEPVINEFRKYVTDPRLIIQTMAQAIAQTLVDQPYKKAYLYYGQPNYGKTMIGIDLIARRFLSKDIQSKIPLNMLSNEKDNRFSIASLEGKIMNIKDEMSYFNMRDGNTFKEITGSFDIWAEKKGKMGYAARTTAVHLFIENRLAKFDSQIRDDEGFWIRVMPVNFNVTRFPRDTKAANRIFTSEFMAGLFNLVLEMTVEMLKTGDLVIDLPWEEAREKWMMNSEPAYQFIVDNMVRVTDENEFTPVLKKDLLKQVQLWYDEEFSDMKARPETISDLTNAVKLAGGVLDERRMFWDKLWDRNSNPVYKIDSTGAPILDEKGNPVQAYGNKEKACYVLPWKWKDGNKYGSKVSRCNSAGGGE